MPNQKTTLAIPALMLMAPAASYSSNHVFPGRLAYVTP